jgi:hypothetical protein
MAVIRKVPGSLEYLLRCLFDVLAFLFSTWTPMLRDKVFEGQYCEVKLIKNRILEDEKFKS